MNPTATVTNISRPEAGENAPYYDRYISLVPRKRRARRIRRAAPPDAPAAFRTSRIRRRLPLRPRQVDSERSTRPPQRHRTHHDLPRPAYFPRRQNSHRRLRAGRLRSQQSAQPASPIRFDRGSHRRPKSNHFFIPKSRRRILDPSRHREQPRNHRASPRLSHRRTRTPS